MGKRPDIWMPLYIGAYLADTMHLTRDQHGAYFLLIMAYWRRGQALPDDDAQLAAIVKASPTEWRKLRPVLAQFFKIGAGIWWQKRIEAELATAANTKSGRSKAGTEGARKRWQSDGNRIANAIAKPSQNDSPSPSPSPSPCIPSPSGEGVKSRASPRSDAFAPMVEIWREECGGALAVPSKPIPSRVQKSAARLRDSFGGDLDGWRAYCARIAGSPFLTGDNDRGWRADFDWALEPRNLARIEEGKYDGRHVDCGGAKAASGHDRPDGPPPRPEELYGDEYAGTMGVAH